MKRIIVFLLLAALLLGGCGTRTPETEAREAQSTSTAAPGTETRDWSEPNAVDDGYSFRHDPAAYYEETGDDSGLSGLIEKTLLPEYVDRWVDGGEVLWTEFHGLSSGGNQSGTYYGWIAFTGMPTTELGWRTADFSGTKCYCRSIFIRELPNGDNTYTIVAAKSWPMDVVLVNDTVAAIGIEDLFSGRALPTLASAELYVPQLGQSFVMTEETALRSLEKALSKEAATVHITPREPISANRKPSARSTCALPTGDARCSSPPETARTAALTDSILARCLGRKAYLSASACRWTPRATRTTPTAAPP